MTERGGLKVVAGGASKSGKANEEKEPRKLADHEEAALSGLKEVLPDLDVRVHGGRWLVTWTKNGHGYQLHDTTDAKTTSVTGVLSRAALLAARTESKPASKHAPPSPEQLAKAMAALENKQAHENARKRQADIEIQRRKAREEHDAKLRALPMTMEGMQERARLFRGGRPKLY